MGKELLKQDRHEIVKRSANNNVEILNPVQNTSPFISFRYSYKEVSSFGDKTHFRSKEKSFENGKYKSEEFEGTLDNNGYYDVIGGMQKHFFNQLTSFMKTFAMFFPFGGSKDKGK